MVTALADRVDLQPSSIDRAGRLHDLTFWLLCATVFTVPWQKLVLVDGVGTITRLLGLGAAAVAGAAVVAEGRQQRLVDAHVVMLLFGGWVVASTLWTTRPDATLGAVVVIVQVIALAWMVSEFAHGPWRLHTVMLAYVLGVALTAGITILQFRADPSAGARFSASEAAHPNGIAFMMCLAIPMAWDLGLRARRRWSLAALWLSIPLTVLAIVLTASRSAILLLGVALLIIPMTWHRLPLRYRRLILIGAAIALAGIVSVVPERPVERLAALRDGLGTDALDMRRVLLDASWTIVSERPVLGAGAGASRYEIAALSGLEQGAHNSYVSVATELGVVGLALFCLILLAVGFRVLSIRGPQRPLALVLAATLVLGLVPRHWEYDKATWLVLAILLGIGLSHSSVGTEPARAGGPWWRAPGSRRPTPDVHAAGHRSVSYRAAPPSRTSPQWGQTGREP